MKLSDAFDLFITDAIAAGRSPYTLKWYRQYIGRLLRYLGDVELRAVSIDNLREFLASLWSADKKWVGHKYHKPVSGGLAAPTVAGYVRAIKAFYNWLEENDHITAERNWGRRLKIPRLPKAEPKSVADEDLEKLLIAARCSKRDYALVLFLADTGCRVGGLSNFQLSHLKLSERQAILTEKGMNTRTVFFGRRTAAALECWLIERKSKTEFVFVTEKGKPLTAWGIRQILKRLKHRAGVTGRANPHAFRHRYARAYIKNGGDLATLSDLMGHTDVLVTKRAYAIFLTTELQRKHDENSPLIGIKYYKQTTSSKRVKKNGSQKIIR
ncbi:MAG TPA: tyrosine-type recombinase/integrase [Anaerolineae bacterium]|nr:tyrosine-type recombinase/integrase [Anaerolineae bacterium]